MIIELKHHMDLGYLAKALCRQCNDDDIFKFIKNLDKEQCSYSLTGNLKSYFNNRKISGIGG
jgi:hypothetical protein